MRTTMETSLVGRYLLCFFLRCVVNECLFHKDRVDLGRSLLGQTSNKISVSEENMSSSFKGNKLSSFKWNTNLSYAPGRFKQSTYPNVSIKVQFTKDPNATPYQSTHCAPGLTCLFSDKMWHKVSW